jgi:hypothetical protein
MREWKNCHCSQFRTVWYPHTHTHTYIYIVTYTPIARERATNSVPKRWVLENQFVTEHISMDTKMKDVSTEIDYWKPIRRCRINRRFRGYDWSTNISLDTDTLYKRPFKSEWNQSRVEVRSNTSTVALRVVGGDVKRNLESERVKYCREFHGIRTRDWLR